MENNNDKSKTAIYSIIKRRLSILEIIINIIVLLVLAFSPFSKSLTGFIEFHAENPYLQFMLFCAVLGIIFFIIGAPIDYYGGFIIEHEFGLSNQSFKDWIKENIKSDLLGIVIGIPVALVFFFIIRSAGYYWWIFFGLFLFMFSVLLARLAPTLLFPIFYKFTPLENEEIKNKIVSLMSKFNINISGIFEFNMSKNTKKANAGFTGLGSTKRIILSDTLISGFTPDEIEVIFAHELGHYMKKHIVKNIFISGTIILATFFICGKFYEWTLSQMGFIRPDEIAAFPILLLYIAVFSMLTMPLTNTISRYFEVEADTFALASTKNKTSFISSMEKLSEINLADKEPNKVYEFIFYSHPSLKKRIDFANKFEI